MFIVVPILPSFKRDPSIGPLILIIEVVIIEVGIGLTKIRITVKTGITVRLIHLRNQLKGAVSIGSATITIDSILFSTLTSVISNITSRIANIIEVILSRIGNIITKTNRITKIIVVIRTTTRTNRIVSRTVSKAVISVVDLALSLV